MASSDDFREQLKAGNITEALALALSKAIELKITTWVASAADDIEADQAKPGHRLHTRINTIDGDIENEIGDLFLGNGPYRELRQLHLEQVAEGNKIIQNNLKSLQKLFEILVTMRYPSATAPSIEPEALDIESQSSPPAESLADAGLLIDPPLLPVEESVVSPDTVVENLTEVGLVIESQPTAVEDSVVSPNTLIQVETTQLQPSPPEEPSPLPPPPIDSQELLDEEIDEEDDWDDSVLDLLESLPVESPPALEDTDSESDEDWGDLIEEELEPDLDASNLDADRDWGILTLDDLEDDLEEDLEEPPTSPDLRIEPSNSELDEDWGDLVEPETEPTPDKPPPRMESLNLEENDEWDEWIVEEPEPPPNESVGERSLLDLEDDEDWDELVEYSDPFAAAPAPDRSLSDLDLEENWDDFATDELDTFSDFLDEDTNLDPPDLLDNLDSNGSDIERSDLRDTLQTDAPTEDTRFDSEQSQQSDRDSVDALLENTEPPEGHSPPAVPDDSVVHTLEEAMLAQPPEGSEQGVSPEDSGSETISEEELNAHPKPIDKRMPPPPPPPSRFPHRNN